MPADCRPIGAGTMRLLAGLTIFLLAAAASAAPTLAPRHPAVPPGTASNPVDLFLQRYFQQHGVTPPATVSDAIFARRAYLDVWGLLPTPRAIPGVRRRPPPRQAPAPGARAARQSPQLRRALDQFLERSAAQRRRRDLPRAAPIHQQLAVSGDREQHALRSLRAGAAPPHRARRPQGISDRRQLARHRERQPDSRDAGGAEHRADFPGRQSQVQFLPRQLHQPLETGRCVRPGQLLLRRRRSMSTAATSSPAPKPR